MEVKPPVAIAAVVVLLVLLFGAYKLYERGQTGAPANQPRMTLEQYRALQHKGTGP
jgi:hypothetical protein